MDDGFKVGEGEPGIKVIIWNVIRMVLAKKRVSAVRGGSGKDCEMQRYHPD